MVDGRYLGLLAATAAERLAELQLAERNGRRALARGGREVGQQHYPWMVVLHTALLAGCVIEPMVAKRPLRPGPWIWLVGVAHVVRWACIWSLGDRWNTRVITVPGEPLVASGPYRWMKHPNYAAVVIEGAALPMVHSAWVTAAAFTVLNAALLTVRIRCEEAALGDGR